jgi:hypothetical protein
MRLPDEELHFFYAAANQLTPELRPVFTERVARYLGAHPDSGPGTIDRAIREALVGLWVPPPDDTKRAVSRWSQRADRMDGWASGARRRRVVPAS